PRRPGRRLPCPDPHRPGGGRMNTTVHPARMPAPARAYLVEIRCELLRMLREPAYCVPVIAFPALFYVLFGVLLNRGNQAAAEYLLASYGVFGVIGAAMFGFGVTIAMDRERGYLRLRRAMPTPPGALLLARMVMAALFAVIISIVLALLATTLAGVSLAPAQWAALLPVTGLGGLPLPACGLWLGTLVGGTAARVLLNALYLPMAFLSGLWLPLSMLPEWIARAAPVWPAYHLAQLAQKVVGQD